MQVFISYRRKSWPFTTRLAQELQKQLRGNVFVDMTDIDEDDFEHSIMRNLRASDVFVLIITEHTFTLDRINQTGDWVRREIGEALRLELPIVLAMVDGLTPPSPDQLPDDIRVIAGKQGIEFYPRYFDAGVEELANFIKTIVPPRRRPGRIAATIGAIVVILALVAGGLLILPGLRGSSILFEASATPELQVEEVRDPTPEEAETEQEQPELETCENPIHAVQPGETLYSIAAQYDVSATQLIDANTILNPDFDPELLFLGESLEIPICGLPISASELPTSVSGEVARALAEAGVYNNAEWLPYIETIDGIKMALVPAGCFQIGSTLEDAIENCEADRGEGRCDEYWFTNDIPVHEVCFDAPFWIDVYEVTNHQYGEAAANCLNISSFDNQPRVCISWIDSEAHCKSRGARLPTEAEWEYAARGPDNLVYSWGNEFVAGNVVYFGNSEDYPLEVGSKPGGGSWIGAYDLIGNSWEWVNDWYSDTYYNTLSDSVVNPQGPSSGESRMLRGGSWNNVSYVVRATVRHSSNPAFDNPDFGFRCARDYTP